MWLVSDDLTERDVVSAGIIGNNCLGYSGSGTVNQRSWLGW